VPSEDSHPRRCSSHPRRYSSHLCRLDLPPLLQCRRSFHPRPLTTNPTHPSRMLRYDRRCVRCSAMCWAQDADLLKGCKWA
jgi:hypothetical protein